MEQPAYYLFLALLLPLLLLTLLKKRHHGGGGGHGVRLPPGPWRLPVIGSLHHLIGKPLTHRALADLARRLDDAPLMYLKLGEVPVVVATSRDAAREVMRAHDVAFATRPSSPTIRIMMQEGQGLVFAPYGDLWRQLRRISVLELLSARRHEEQRAMAAANGTDKEGEEEEEDLVDVLLRVQKDGGLDVPLTMGIIKALILDLFSAGSETSATTLQWAMAELMRNPEVMKKAQAELRGTLNGKPKVTEDDLAQMKYMKLIIKETLRLHPAAPLLLPREARESCKVLGYDVPKGTTVLVNAWAIGRDPRYWDDPEDFKPERFECGTIDFKGLDFEFIPFGAGRRICPGMVFAQSNIELALAALLYHFDWELTDGLKPSDLDMTEDVGLTVRKKSDLLLHPIIRVPL
nr:unnamed protein product [Digitaria exilis]